MDDHGIEISENCADGKFIAVWVIAWNPIISAVFITFMPVINEKSDVRMVGLFALCYLFALFAPAIWRIWFRRSYAGSNQPKEQKNG
jgi:hypothetical protein